MNHTIKAVKTDHSLAGEKNILTDTLYEMGYGHDDNLVDTLIERNVIDFSRVNYTSDVMYYLIEHYGEEVLCGGLVRAVAREGLITELKDADEQNWRSLRWGSLKKFVPYIIVDEVESLGLRVANGRKLKVAINLSKQLSQVKQNLLIDYGGEFGCHLPDVEMIICHPDTCKVLAVVSGKVTSNRIDQTIKLSQDEVTKHIKVYFIGSDEDDTLSDNNPLEKSRAIVESDLDESWVLTGTDTADSEKAKRFEHFIEELKEALGLDINSDALSDTR
jgi:type II restriction enzyme